MRLRPAELRAKRAAKQGAMQRLLRERGGADRATRAAHEELSGNPLQHYLKLMTQRRADGRRRKFWGIYAWGLVLGGGALGVTLTLNQALGWWNIRPWHYPLITCVGILWPLLLLWLALELFETCQEASGLLAQDIDGRSAGIRAVLDESLLCSPLSSGELLLPYFRLWMSRLIPPLLLMSLLFWLTELSVQLRNFGVVYPVGEWAANGWWKDFAPDLMLALVFGFVVLLQSLPLALANLALSLCAGAGRRRGIAAGAAAVAMNIVLAGLGWWVSATLDSSWVSPRASDLACLLARLGSFSLVLIPLWLARKSSSLRWLLPLQFTILSILVPLYYGLNPPSVSRYGMTYPYWGAELVFLHSTAQFGLVPVHLFGLSFEGSLKQLASYYEPGAFLLNAALVWVFALMCGLLAVERLGRARNQLPFHVKRSKHDLNNSEQSSTPLPEALAGTSELIAAGADGLAGMPARPINAADAAAGAAVRGPGTTRNSQAARARD